jgi:L-fuconolactonase
MIIDAHQHVWDLTRAPYPWLGPHVPLWNRTFEFEELVPHLARNGVEATVLVQSDDDDGDTALMFEVADAHPTVVAIVAYLPARRTAPRRPGRGHSQPGSPQGRSRLDHQRPGR